VSIEGSLNPEVILQLVSWRSQLMRRAVRVRSSTS